MEKKDFNEVKQEMEEISPLLAKCHGRLSRDSGLDDYFESLPDKVWLRITEKKSQRGKVVSLIFIKKPMRYAAIFIAVMGLAWGLFNTMNHKPDISGANDWTTDVQIIEYLSDFPDDLDEGLLFEGEVLSDLELQDLGHLDRELLSEYLESQADELDINLFEELNY